MTTSDELKLDNQELRRRLEEAEDTLRALCAGEVDAVLVAAEREQVYTLETADKPYRLLVEQMPQAAATLTVEGAILSCNRRFAELLGRPLRSLLRRPFRDFVVPAGRPEVEALLRESLNGEVQAEVPLERAGGAPFSAYLRVAALKEGALGQCLMVTDQTEQRHYQELRRTQESLRQVSERLELAQEAGRIGTYEWDLGTGKVTWSAVQEELYGMPRGGFGGRYEDWKRTVHPDDVGRIEAAIQHALSGRAELDLEFRIVRPDGETRWIAVRGRVLRDDQGEPRRVVGVTQDVSDRKHAVEELEKANAEKDEFLATLAHELRNPLAPIRNAVELLLPSALRHPDLQWAREIIDRQVHVMARLLEDLLDVSRLSRMRLELRKERVELAAVVEAALETSRPLIEAGHHELTLYLPPGSLPLDADPVRLAQVFSNLLNNAAKYTEDGGRIRLSAERRGPEVVVSVRDNGIGIAPELLPRIFEIFSQGTPTSMPSGGGLGIGLSLVKGLVDLHGGSVEVRCEGPGHGSEFLVRLPVAQSPPPEPAPPGDACEPARPTKRRVLIVDDNRDSADSLARILKREGNEVRTAYDGEHALQAAAELRPDIVLLDIGMPLLDGYEACRRIRREPWGRAILLIAVTGWGQEADRRRTAEAGFDLHIVKPVHPAKLMELMVSMSPGQVANR